MGLWTLAGTFDGTSPEENAVLVDSVTMTPLPVLFATREEADDFVAWMISIPGSTDPRKQSAEDLKEDLEHFRTLVPCCDCERVRVHKDIGRCDSCSGYVRLGRRELEAERGDYLNDEAKGLKVAP